MCCRGNLTVAPNNSAWSPFKLSNFLFLSAYPTICLLPSALGPCSDWTTRWYFVPDVGKCNRFWYGGCHGNKNNFGSEEECMNTCQKIPGRTTGTIEYRYRKRGMKWDRLSHENPRVHEGEGFGSEPEQRRGIVKTLDGDIEGRILAGHDGDEHNMDHRMSGPSTDQSQYAPKAEDSSTSHHSSLYRYFFEFFFLY